jgi:hypothetical protein
MHPDANLASVFLGHRKGFDMGIELTPLSSPIGADLFFSTTLPPSEAFGQLTFCVISANTPPMSRLLNAEYACPIMVLVSATLPLITLAVH